MQAPSPRHCTRPRVSIGSPALLLLATTALVAGCVTTRERMPTPPPAPAPEAAAPRPKVVTVPQLQDMVELGTTIPVMFGEIQGSGTVYRLTLKQAKDLRASGMPASVMSYLESTYQHAVQQNPALASSNEHWTEIDGYWDGGLPFGGPNDWVAGAPAPGELLRR
jgi:hypothetical protein